jgi:predicted  nucleic acid-binding Zn-ribbon protein
MKNISIHTETAFDIVKFPSSALNKSETELLDGLVKMDKEMDALIRQLDWLTKEVKKIRETLDQDRYKLNLIKSAFFVKGWNKTLDYWKDDKGLFHFEKETKKT